jgi:hypothetical protein
VGEGGKQTSQSLSLSYAGLEVSACSDVQRMPTDKYKVTGGLVEGPARLDAEPSSSSSGVNCKRV